MRLLVLVESLLDMVELERLAEHAGCSIELHDGPFVDVSEPLFLRSERVAEQPWSDEPAATRQLWLDVRAWVAELDGLGRLIYARTGATLRLLNLQYEDETGARQWVPVTGSINGVMHGMGTLCGQADADPVRARLTRLAPALIRPEVRRVRAAWAARDHHDWVSLYKIYELIRDDGGMVAPVGVTRSWLKRFTMSADHPGISGDAARHAVMEGEPKKSKALSLADAEHGIRRWTLGWIEAKVKG